MNKDTRTDEELNRIIAEWMGWKIAVDPNFNGLKNAGQNHGHRSIWWTEIPSYCSDLNAIHEAEKKASFEELKKQHHVMFHTIWDNKPDMVEHVKFELVYATARQRAEALVAVIESTKP